MRFRGGASSATLTLKRRFVDIVMGSFEPLQMTLSWRTRTTLPTSLCATDPSLNDNCSNGWTELHYREADPRCGKALVETSHLCKSFQLVDETETDPMFEDTTLGHQAMFEAAKKTVMQMAHVDTVQGLTCDAQVIDVKGHLAENHTLFRNRHSTQCSALRLGPPRVASGRGHELARVLPMLQIASLTSRPVTRNNFYSGPMWYETFKSGGSMFACGCAACQVEHPEVVPAGQ